MYLSLTIDSKQRVFITENTWGRGEIRQEARKFERKHAGVSNSAARSRYSFDLGEALLVDCHSSVWSTARREPEP